MTNFQILRAFGKALDEGIDTATACKECVEKMLEHGHLLPIGHHGPTKAH